MRTRGRKTRHNLSLGAKWHAIRRIYNGETKASVSREIGVPESTLRGWCKKALKFRLANLNIGRELFPNTIPRNLVTENIEYNISDTSLMSQSQFEFNSALDMTIPKERDEILDLQVQPFIDTNNNVTDITECVEYTPTVEHSSNIEEYTPPPEEYTPIVESDTSTIEELLFDINMYSLLNATIYHTMLSQKKDSNSIPTMKYYYIDTEELSDDSESDQDSDDSDMSCSDTDLIRNFIRRTQEDNPEVSIFPCSGNKSECSSNNLDLKTFDFFTNGNWDFLERVGYITFLKSFISTYVPKNAENCLEYVNSDLTEAMSVSTLNLIKTSIEDSTEDQI